MIDPSELAPRYAPGEDPAPLLRAVAGGVVAAAVALGVDRLVGGPGPDGWIWPSALADLLLGDATSIGTGIALTVVLAAFGGLVYAYGQVRRFLPGPSWLKGAAAGAVVWLALAPVLLPRAPGWLSSAGAAEATAQASVVVLETLAGALLAGIVLGVANPPRDA